MTLEQFWKIIESSRAKFDPGRLEGNMSRQIDELRRLLSTFPPEEIIAFRDHFLDRMNEAFSWELWGAVYLIAGGCSDDGFVDFRSWLISMGRQVFEASLSNPELLLEVVDAPGIEDVFFEEFRTVPEQIHEDMTGREIPPPTRKARPFPSGEKWSEDEEDLAIRFPALWAKYRR